MAEPFRATDHGTERREPGKSRLFAISESSGNFGPGFASKGMPQQTNT